MSRAAREGGLLSVKEFLSGVPFTSFPGEIEFQDGRNEVQKWSSGCSGELDRWLTC